MKKFFALIASVFLITLLAACNSGSSNAQEKENENKSVENEVEVKEEPKEEVKEAVNVELTTADREKAKEKIGEINDQIVFSQLMVDMSLQKVNIGGETDGIKGVSQESFKRIPMKSPYIDYLMETLPSIDMEPGDHNELLSILKKWKENNFDEVDQDVRTTLIYLNKDVPDYEPTTELEKKTPEEEQEYIDKYIKE